MKKVISLLIVIFLTLVTFVPVTAQGPSTYESTVTVSNLSETEGTITLQFIDPNGTLVDEITEPIDPLETIFYTTFPVASGFEGSMVIASSVPLASTSTIKGKSSSNQIMNYASFVGVSSGATKVYLPLLMDSNYGFNTFYSIQNVSGSPVDVTITYSDGVVSDVVGLEPNAAVIINNEEEAHAKKKFSGIVEATGDIAVTVVEWADGAYGKQLLSYNGFTEIQGTTNPIIPMVNQNNYGYWTSIPIQNLGTEDTTVTLTYNPTKDGSRCTETLFVPAGGWAEFGQNAHVFKPQTPNTTCKLGQKFVGTAIVTQNSTNQPIIGLMNQTTTIHPTWDKAAALTTLNPDLATSRVAFPEAYQYFTSEHWWSSITISNVSGDTLPAGDVVCRGIGQVNGNPIDQTWSNQVSIPDGSGWITDMERDWGPMPVGFIGGVTCESTSGASILGTLNNLGHESPESLDSYTMFEGVNY
jgi:hypothetical protein